MRQITMKNRCHAAALAGVLLLCVSVAVCQTPAPTGRIDGSVQTADEKPVAKAMVAFGTRPIQPGVAFTPYQTLVLTAEDGTFSLSGIPDGVYAVCPQLPKSSLTPPCTWGSEPRVTVAGGQTVKMAPIQMQSGADLYIRVNDSNGTRASAEGKVAGAGLLLAVRAGNGNLIPIPKTASDKGGFDHHLSVPTGMDLVFVAHSGFYAMTDKAGAQIAKQNGLARTINIAKGQTQHQEVINVH